MPSARKKSGLVLPVILVLFAFITAAAIAWISLNTANFFSVSRQATATTALGIAEAGINYYHWHIHS